MLITPRQYQIDCVKSIYTYFENKAGNPVCALPTGTGKSVIIAMFLQSVFMQFPKQKVLIATHVKELVAQNYAKLMEIWPEALAGINSAGLKRRDTLHNIIFAGIGSIRNSWEELGRVDLLIIDEAHLVSPNDETMYSTLINNLKKKNPYLKVIGFTATPWRLGQGKITDDGIFTDICFDNTSLEAFNQLIKEGYLARLVPKKMKTTIDTDSLHIRAGDFIPAELQLAVDKASITTAAVKEAIELGEDRKHWLVFATGIDHAEHITETLCDLGVAAKVIHSKLSDNERDEILRQFKAGTVRAVVNVGVLTTGFDFPAIDMIVMLRPTMSPVLWVQMLGRGTRPCYGKENCLVLDFAGNTKRLGAINDPVIPRKKGAKGGDAPIKCCDHCGTYNHASVKICDGCGAEFTFKVKINYQASTSDIIREDLPIVETFEVEHITYAKHEKVGKPPSLKVSYYSGLRMFTEYVCLEHPMPIRNKAVKWWRERFEGHTPETIDGALTQTDLLDTPTHIKVWVNTQYPQIMAFCFDGSAFGANKVLETDNKVA